MDWVLRWGGWEVRVKKCLWWLIVRKGKWGFGVWHKMDCWGRATVGIRLVLDYNLLYNTKKPSMLQKPYNSLSWATFNIMKYIKCIVLDVTCSMWCYCTSHAVHDVTYSTWCYYTSCTFKYITCSTLCYVKYMMLRDLTIHHVQYLT